MQVQPDILLICTRGIFLCKCRSIRIYFIPAPGGLFCKNAVLAGYNTYLHMRGYFLLEKCRSSWIYDRFYVFTQECRSSWIYGRSHICTQECKSDQIHYIPAPGESFCKNAGPAGYIIHLHLGIIADPAAFIFYLHLGNCFAEMQIHTDIWQIPCVYSRI